MSCRSAANGRRRCSTPCAAPPGYLRGEVNRRVSLKFSPTLIFELDRSFEQVRRIDGLLGGGDQSDG